MKSQWSTKRFLLAYFAVFFATSGTATANTILFTDTFSTDLSAWTGKSGGSHQGIIVGDPLNAANQVLSFSGLNLSGDIFTATPLDVEIQARTVISFDYLGVPSAGSNPGNLGGFFGISVDLLPEGGDGAWIAGTEQSAANGLGFTGIELIDDGQWHRYDIDITTMLSANNISSIYLLLEDWRDAGGIPGDAYFDNVEVRAVSVADGGSTLLLLSVSLLSGIARGRFSYRGGQI